MFELLALIGLVVVGVFLLKVTFGVLGFLFHLVFLPLKLLGAVLVTLLVLPFLVTFLPRKGSVTLPKCDLCTKNARR